MNDPNGACQACRAQLDALLSHELADDARLQVELHLQNCPICTAEFEAGARQRRQLQTAVRDTPVPKSLHARVHQTLRSGAPRRHTGLWAVAAAVLVIICVFLATRLRTLTDPEQAILHKSSGRLAALFNVGLRDHLQCAVFRKYSRQPLPASQLAADLGPSFAGLAPLIGAKLPSGFRILQAHHCTAGGRQYTHFIIDAGGKTMSVILTRAETGESLAGGIYQEGVDRFQVVGFEANGYLAYVISDLDPQQNLQIAANLAPAVRAFLAAHTG